MKALTKYLKSRKDAIHSLLLKPSWTYSAFTFHKLRVEIKRLNALFELINYCKRDFKRKKSFEPFKKIFVQAGKVRELQVEALMLKNFFNNNLLKDYRDSLKKQGVVEQQKFFSIIDLNFTEMVRRKFHEITPFISEVNKKKINAYIDWQRANIEKLLNQKTLQTEQLHILRKRLKSFYYNLESLGLHKKPHQKNDILSALLGEWHDCQVIIRHLNKARDTGAISPVELSQVEKAKEKFFSYNEVLFEKIIGALNSTEFSKSKFPEV